MDPSEIPVVQFTQANTYRLIATAYIDEPALQPLVDDSEDLALLEDLEGLTSSRLVRGIPLPKGVFLQELLTCHDGYGWTYVNAAFCYTRQTGNRFNDADRGAWYAAWGDSAIVTAQAEVGWHLSQELQATGVFDNTTAYRELIAGFTTSLHDLRDLHRQSTILHPDPDIAYPAGQALMTSLRVNESSNGVLYPSVRHPKGYCLAALRPNLVQNIRPGSTWEFCWRGSTEPQITKLH